MSRHTYDDPDTNLRWHIGWERAQSSYFAQVEPTPGTDRTTEGDFTLNRFAAYRDEGDSLSEVVDGYWQVRDLDELLAHLEPHVHVPKQLVRDLVTDRLTDRPRTATTAVDEARQALQLSRAMFPTPAVHAATTYGVDKQQQRDVVDARGAELTGTRGASGADAKHPVSHAVRRARGTSPER
ncbi:hypothetical protein [Angustibacter aerolatus]